VSSPRRDGAIGAAILGLLLLNVAGVAAAVVSLAQTPLADVAFDDDAEPEPYLPLSEEALREFGEQLQVRAERQGSRTFEAFDVASMVEPVLDRVDADHLARGRLVRVLMEQNFLDVLDLPGVEYTFRGVVQDEGGRWARFRVTGMPEPTFHDLKVGRRGGGAARVYGVRMPVTDGLLADGWLRSAEAFEADPSQVEALERLPESGGGDWTAVREAWSALAPAVRGAPGVPDLYLIAAEDAGPEALAEAVADVEALEGLSEVAAASYLRAAYVSLERWDDARAAIATLAGAWPDPTWDVEEARVELAAGNAAQALARARRAADDEPSLRDAQLMLFRAAWAAEETELARRTLNTLVTDFEVDAVALSRIPGFEGVDALMNGPPAGIDR
jgi:hypothetical protein